MSIRFKARLFSPMEGKGWTFATMPKAASAQLGAKGRVPVAGTINGHPFRTSAFPDGEGSHMIQVNGEMRKGAKAETGDTAEFSIERATDDVQVTVPKDFKTGLVKHPAAAATFEAITPKARAEWVAHLESAKREETRVRRLGQVLDALAAGQKRPKS